MYQIIDNHELSAGVFRYVVKAPEIARKAQPGQFVILRLTEHGERIPITIADADTERGTLTLFIQAVGKTSLEISRMKSGGSILNVVGPLGLPTEIKKFGTVVLVGGGFGIAAIHPIAKALTAAGNKTVSILGARNQDLLILEKEMRAVSSEVRIATDDGSAGTRGFVTDLLQKMIENKERVDRVIAIGPLVMMKAVADLTQPHRIKTLVSLNPIMIDGTGMCGACRVIVGSEMKFACVDGPEFDGHLVDFDILLNRLKTYQPEEQKARDQFLHPTDPECRLEEKIKSSDNLSGKN